MPNSSPWYPARELTYGQVFFFIRNKTYNLSPFDKASILEAKSLTLKEAYAVCPTYKMFLKAATQATGLGERTIKKLIYETTTKT